MNPPGGNLGLGVILGWCYSGVALIVRYVRFPIILAVISKTEFGVWQLFLSIVTVAMTSELILGQIATREVAAFYPFRMAQERFVFAALMRTIDRLYRIAVGLIALIFLGATAFIPFLVKGEMALPRLLALWFGCAASTLLYLYGSRRLAVMDGLQEVWIARLVKVLYEIAGFVLLLVMLFPFRLGIYALVLALLAQAALYNSMSVVFLRRILPTAGDTAAHDGPSEVEIWRRVSRSSWKLLSIHIGTTLIYISAFLLIPIYLKVSVLTDYGIFCQLLQLTNYFVLPLIQVWYPTLPTRLAARESLSNILRYIFTASLAVNIGILIGAEPVLNLWVGPGHFLGQSVLMIGVLTAIIDINHVSFRSTLIAADELKKLNWLIWSGVPVSYALSAILGSWKGLVGIMLGPLLVEALFLIVMNSWVRKATAQQRSPVSEILKRCWALIAVLGIAIGITVVRISPNGIATWLLDSVVAFACIVGAYLSLDNREYSRLIQEILRLRTAMLKETPASQ